MAVTALILTGVDGDGRAPLSPGDTVEVTAPDTTDTGDATPDASAPTTTEAAATSVATTSAPVATIRPFVGTTVATTLPATTTTMGGNPDDLKVEG
jgi:hypothetical protein